MRVLAIAEDFVGRLNVACCELCPVKRLIAAHMQALCSAFSVSRFVCHVLKWYVGQV
jgi:hypothetical protein